MDVAVRETEVRIIKQPDDHDRASLNRGCLEMQSDERHILTHKFELLVYIPPTYSPQATNKPWGPAPGRSCRCESFLLPKVDNAALISEWNALFSLRAPSIRTLNRGLAPFVQAPLGLARFAPSRPSPNVWPRSQVGDEFGLLFRSHSGARHLFSFSSVWNTGTYTDTMQGVSLIQSRFAIALLSAVVIIQLFLLLGNRDAIIPERAWPGSHPRKQTDTSSSPPSTNTTSPPPPPSSPWTFNSTRDARNPALTYEQCTVAFPKLYHEIERSATYWKHTRNHSISAKDVNITWTGKGGLRVLIYENELRILETRDIHHFRDGHDARRVIFVLSQIHRALLGATARGEQIPNIEFAIAVNDYAHLPDERGDSHTVWTFDRRIASEKDERMWLMPDFNFWAWKPTGSAYEDARRRAMTHDSAVKDKIPKIVWRGNRHINPEVRKALIETGKGKEWADVEGGWLDIADFCRYLFAVYTEGHSWSGRLKYLLNCDTVAIVHELEFTTSFYHLLNPSGPDQNYIQVKRDWSDLEEKVKYHLERPEHTQRIIQNSIKTFRERYTTPAAEACYWRRMFRAYREVAFEPDAFEEKTINTFGSTETVRHLRGTPYELFIGIDRP